MLFLISKYNRHKRICLTKKNKNYIKIFFHFWFFVIVNMGVVCAKIFIGKKNSLVNEVNLLSPGGVSEHQPAQEKKDQMQKPSLNSNDKSNNLEIHEPELVGSNRFPNPLTLKEKPAYSFDKDNLEESILASEDVSKSQERTFWKQKKEEFSKDPMKSTLKFNNLPKSESIMEKKEPANGNASFKKSQEITSLKQEKQESPQDPMNSTSKIDNLQKSESIMKKKEPANGNASYNREISAGPSVIHSIAFERNQDSLKDKSLHLKNTADLTNITSEVSRSNCQNITISDPSSLIPAERSKESKLAKNEHLMNPFNNIGNIGDSEYHTPNCEQTEQIFEEKRGKFIYIKNRESDYYAPVKIENQHSSEQELKMSQKNEIPSGKKQKISTFNKYQWEESKNSEEDVENPALPDLHEKKNFGKNKASNNNGIRLSDFSITNVKKADTQKSLKTNKREKMSIKNDKKNFMDDQNSIVEEDKHKKEISQSSSQSSLPSNIEEKEENEEDNLNYFIVQENSVSHQTIEKDIEKSDYSSLSEDSQSPNHQINLVKSFSYNFKKRESIPFEKNYIEKKEEEEEVKNESLSKFDEEEKFEKFERVNSHKKNEYDEADNKEVVEKNEKVEKVEKIEKGEKIEKLEKLDSKRKLNKKINFKSELGGKSGIFLEASGEMIDENGVNFFEMNGIYIPKS